MQLDVGNEPTLSQQESSAKITNQYINVTESVVGLTISHELLFSLNFSSVTDRLAQVGLKCCIVL